MTEGEKKKDRNGVIIYLVLWFILMLMLSNPIETWPQVLWGLFAGGVILAELVVVAVWVINKIG